MITPIAQPKRLVQHLTARFVKFSPHIQKMPSSITRSLYLAKRARMPNHPRAIGYTLKLSCFMMLFWLGGALCKSKLVPLHLIPRQARCLGPNCASSQTGDPPSLGMLQLREMQFYNSKTQKVTPRPKLQSEYRPMRLRTKVWSSPPAKDRYNKIGRVNSSQSRQEVERKYINGQTVRPANDGSRQAGDYVLRQGVIPPDEPGSTLATLPDVAPTLETLELIERQPTTAARVPEDVVVTVGRPTSIKAKPVGEYATTNAEQTRDEEDFYDLSYPGPPFPDFLVKTQEDISSSGADYYGPLPDTNRPKEEAHSGPNDPLSNIRNNILQMSVFGDTARPTLFDFDQFSGESDRNSPELIREEDKNDTSESLDEANEEGGASADDFIDRETEEFNLIDVSGLGEDGDFEEDHEQDYVVEVPIQAVVAEEPEDNNNFELSGVMKWYYDNMPKDLLSQVEANLPKRKNRPPIIQFSSPGIQDMSAQSNFEVESLASVGLVNRNGIVQSSADDDGLTGFPQYFGDTNNDDQGIEEGSEMPQNIFAQASEAVPSNSCPSQCMCVCPGNSDAPRNDPWSKLALNSGASTLSLVTEPTKPDGPVPTAKINLGISMYPCSRSAAYQLNMALKLCRRKRKL